MLASTGRYGKSSYGASLQRVAIAGVEGDQSARNDIVGRTFEACRNGQTEDRLGRFRILVVEDDPMISIHLETIIAQTLDADVILSRSTAEAARGLAGPLDFAFLDVDVLDGTTYAFASELDARKIPFAFLSASDREHVPESLKAAPFVAKPYTADEIVDILRTAGKF